LVRRDESDKIMNKSQWAVICLVILATVEEPQHLFAQQEKPVELNESAKPKQRKNVQDDIHQWLDAHSASIVIEKHWDKSKERWVGSIAFLGKTLDVSEERGRLGEQPEMFPVQLMTRGGPLVFAQSGDRHSRKYVIYRVLNANNKLSLEPSLSFEFPWNVHEYGFVFRCDEDQISSLGLVIPKFFVPKGESASAPDFSFRIKLLTNKTEFIPSGLEGGAPKILNEDHVLDAWANGELQHVELAKEKLNERNVVVMGPPGLDMSSVRVLWLTIDPSGVLKRVPLPHKKNEQSPK
jgi:hypothetical protein